MGWTDRYKSASCKNLIELLKYSQYENLNGIFRFDWSSGGSFITHQYLYRISDAIHDQEGVGSKKLDHLREVPTMEKKISLAFRYLSNNPKYRTDHPLNYLLTYSSIKKLTSRTDKVNFNNYTKNLNLRAIQCNVGA